ncbi:DUF3703 domain-containing protein [Flocculibacter collagenilyticus]|uniref:DUF3703 domain-containing protein n=1 Tax=Flocculibacter collagenilyticus TaxID=2744479 RepID=UPI0018F6DDEE|nr:DUF3703 domain-containing protein [Flocculibacter collagenilyticus]
MATFKQLIKPYVEAELTLAEQAEQQGDLKRAFSHLENAHVLGQRCTYYHVKVHLHMFRHGWLTRDWQEVFGQIIRLIGAATKTVFGLLPEGNTGGADVSAFKPMPLSAQHQQILHEVKKKRQAV